MRQLTKDEAIKMSKSDVWKRMTPTELTAFQLSQELLCFPMHVFHENIEKALGRGVFSHEMAYPKNLKEELVGVRKAPSFEDILNLIPEEKLIVVSMGESTNE